MKRKHRERDDEAAEKRQRSGSEPPAAAAPDPSRGLPPPRPLPPHTLVLAPMVGGSELPFRLLARRHGAQLCYTPMLYSRRFVDDAAYRAAELRTAPGDEPLVAHFAGNEPETLLAAARLAVGRCVAVDLNLGCPQRVAHAGNFGAYLCATPAGRATVLRIVRALAASLPVPVFCKVRLLDELDDTLAFCTQLRDAGCALLVVSEELDELFEICDRLQVMAQGRLSPPIRTAEATVEQIGIWMSGLWEAPVAAPSGEDRHVAA